MVAGRIYEGQTLVGLTRKKHLPVQIPVRYHLEQLSDIANEWRDVVDTGR
jgi:hypothetical protein